jgi:hypothetical protein
MRAVGGSSAPVCVQLLPGMSAKGQKRMCSGAADWSAKCQKQTLRISRRHKARAAIIGQPRAPRLWSLRARALFWECLSPSCLDAEGVLLLELNGEHQPDYGEISELLTGGGRGAGSHTVCTHDGALSALLGIAGHTAAPLPRESWGTGEALNLHKSGHARSAPRLSAARPC